MAIYQLLTPIRSYSNRASSACTPTLQPLISGGASWSALCKTGLHFQLATLISVIYLFFWCHFALVDCFFDVCCTANGNENATPEFFSPFTFFLPLFPSFSLVIFICISLVSGLLNYSCKLPLTPCFCCCTTVQGMPPCHNCLDGRKGSNVMQQVNCFHLF